MEFLVLLLLILVNGLFAMSEIAVVSSRKTRLQQWADEGKAGAGVALELASEPPEEESGAYHTLSGFILMRLGRIPAVADHFSWHGWRFEVVDMDGNRIDKVLASPVRES